jgi:hypothetical protein
MSYKTGEKAPFSGDYKFIKHIDGTTRCTNAEEIIPLSEKEVFPPHKSCNKGCCVFR